MARFASLRSALVLLAALLALTAIAPAGRVAAQEAATPEPATETAGGEDTFNALRAEILSRPIVYGPEDGSLTHDPERVTLASTGVDLRDFAVRIECVAPISAAEGFWDCGLFFRDVIGEEHFRFGIVSDQTWFLSIGSAAPLQAGSGIDVSIQPVPAHDSENVHWWQSVAGLHQTSSEYLKLLLLAIGYHA